MTICSYNRIILVEIILINWISPTLWRIQVYYQCFIEVWFVYNSVCIFKIFAIVMTSVCTEQTNTTDKEIYIHHPKKHFHPLCHAHTHMSPSSLPACSTLPIFKQPLFSHCRLFCISCNFMETDAYNMYSFFWLSIFNVLILDLPQLLHDWLFHFNCWTVFHYMDIPYLVLSIYFLMDDG